MTKSFRLLQKPLYNSLSTGNNWHIPNGQVNSCWNFNGDHGVNKCKLPKDQARIEANTKKWEDEKKKKSGSVGGNSGSEGKHYERSKFGGGTGCHTANELLVSC